MPHSLRHAPMLRLFAGAAAVTLLAGCGGADKAEKPAEGDPAVEGALADQIMVDPELAGQNKAGDAIVAGSQRVALAPQQRGPEAIAAARAEAAKLAGGALQALPAPVASADMSPLVEQAAALARVTPEARAARADCSARVSYAMEWAARLPEALAVYPHAAVQEAAGIDAEGCRLRAITFVTPVAPADVVSYYYTRVRKSGYGADYRQDGKESVLGGARQGSAYILYVRPLDDGLTEVDLVASGS